MVNDLKRRFANVRAQLECSHCGDACRGSLEYHYRWNEACKKKRDAEVGICEPCGDEDDELFITLMQVSEQQRSMADALSKLRYDRSFNGPDVEAAKVMARTAIRVHNARAAAALKHFLRPGVNADDVAAALDAAEHVDSVFSGVDTPKLEMAVLRKMHPFVEPRRVRLDADSLVVSFPLASLLTRMLQHNQKVREAVIAKSEEWKTGRLYRQAPESFSGLDSGTALRNHRGLMRKATAAEARDIRIGGLLYWDEIEVAPPSPPPPPALPPTPTHPCIAASGTNGLREGPAQDWQLPDRDRQSVRQGALRFEQSPLVSRRTLHHDQETRPCSGAVRGGLDRHSPR